MLGLVGNLVQALGGVVTDVGGVLGDLGLNLDVGANVGTAGCATAGAAGPEPTPVSLSIGSGAAGGASADAVTDIIDQLDAALGNLRTSIS